MLGFSEDDVVGCMSVDVECIENCSRGFCLYCAVLFICDVGDWGAIPDAGAVYGVVVCPGFVWRQIGGTNVLGMAVGYLLESFDLVSLLGCGCYHYAECSVGLRCVLVGYCHRFVGFAVGYRECG
jgi:hypothetical protein